MIGEQPGEHVRRGFQSLLHDDRIGKVKASLTLLRTEINL
jgi:hypothetical protein